MAQTEMQEQQSADFGPQNRRLIIVDFFTNVLEN